MLGTVQRAYGHGTLTTTLRESLSSEKWTQRNRLTSRRSHIYKVAETTHSPNLLGSKDHAFVQKAESQDGEEGTRVVYTVYLASVGGKYWKI